MQDGGAVRVCMCGREHASSRGPVQTSALPGVSGADALVCTRARVGRDLLASQLGQERALARANQALDGKQLGPVAVGRRRAVAAGTCAHARARVPWRGRAFAPAQPEAEARAAHEVRRRCAWAARRRAGARARRRQRERVDAHGEQRLAARRCQQGAHHPPLKLQGAPAERARDRRHSALKTGATCHGRHGPFA